MPHVIVKLWPGKSEPQNNRLAEEIAKNIEEAKSQGWAESADNRHSRQAAVPQKAGPNHRRWHDQGGHSSNRSTERSNAASTKLTGRSTRAARISPR